MQSDKFCNKLPCKDKKFNFSLLRAAISFKNTFLPVVQGLFWMGRICSHWEQIFPFKNCPLFNGIEIYLSRVISLQPGTYKIWAQNCQNKLLNSAWKPNIFFLLLGFWKMLGGWKNILGYWAEYIFFESYGKFRVARYPASPTWRIFIALSVSI